MKNPVSIRIEKPGPAAAFLRLMGCEQGWETAVIGDLVSIDELRINLQERYQEDTGYRKVTPERKRNPVTRRLENLLGNVLHCANSGPSLAIRSRFYALKERILQRYGTGDGFDVQHIVKECWNCDGTGRVYEDMFHLGVTTSIFMGKCHRCTDGVYEQFWVRLERHRLGEHVFHTPRERYYQDPELVLQHPVIEGYVRHREYPGHLPAEAALWLFLVFEPRTFFKVLGGIGFNKARTPLCALSTLLFEASRIPGRIKSRYEDWRWRKSAHFIDDDDCPF